MTLVLACGDSSSAAPRENAKKKPLAGRPVPAAAAIPAAKREKPKLSFIKDIVPIFTKFGCAGSNCHGSIRGQAGFKLSLFGYEPDLDYNAIVKAGDGHRINLADPAKSLILLKPTASVEHGGGERFKVGSLEYEAILDWLRDGASYDSAGSPRLSTIRVTPEEVTLVGLHAKQQLSVSGTYTDGTTEDLTRKVQYSANDESVVEVTPNGELSGRRPGETAIMVRTLGKAVAARIAVIEKPLKDYPDVPRNNFIDELIFSKLKRVHIVPSPLSSDAEFLRRVYLDTVGLLPTLEESERFLQSKDPQKRSKLIAELVDRPEFAEVWATRFSDLFRVGLFDQRSKGGRQMYSWLRKSLLEDKPYNQMATELLTASGSLYFNATSNFYYITEFSEPDNIATNVSQVFLGVRLECARCHNHPWEKWTQEDFWGFAAFFGRMGVKDTYQNDESEITMKPEGVVISPKTKKAVEAKVPRRPERERAAGRGYPREARPLDRVTAITPGSPAPWSTASSNTTWGEASSSRSTISASRIPRRTKPCSTRSPRISSRTAFTSKQTVRTILNSRAYQLTSEPNDTNRNDSLNYSHYYVRRLLAEELIDVMAEVTGVPEKFPGYMLGTRAMTIPQGAPTYFLQTFGRLKQREVICERDNMPDVAQAMHLITGDTIQHQLTGKDGTLDQLLADASLSDKEITRRLFLVSLVHPPSAAEEAKILESLKQR